LPGTIVLLAALVLASPSTARTEAREAFARALGVAPAAVQAAQEITLGSGGHAARARSLLLGTCRVAGKGLPALVELHPCRGQTCPARVVRLPAGRTVRPLALLDLAGAAPTGPVSLVPARGRVPKLEEPTSPRFLALLLIIGAVSADRVATDTLVLVDLRGPPSMLWQETIRSEDAEGAGFATLEMRLEGAAGKPRTIALLQHALPRRGDKDFRPGPPRTLRFQLRGSTYRRVSPPL
jgi:hypothetical protein